MSSVIDPFEHIPTEVDPFELNAEMPVGILSPSSIATFLTCPEQFRRQYVLGMRRAPGAWGVAGTAFHEARHKALEQQMKDGVPFTEGELRAAYKTAWGDEVTEEVNWRGDDPATVEGKGWAMTLLYHNELGRHVKPIRMEVGVKGYVPGVPVPIYGKIDVETEEEVIDTKTGKQLFHKAKPEHYVQGVLYVYMVGKPIRWHSVSQKPAATTSDQLRLLPTPKVLRLAERFTTDAYDGITHALRTRGRDEEWPGTGPVKGACLYCSFRSGCAYVPA